MNKKMLYVAGIAAVLGGTSSCDYKEYYKKRGKDVYGDKIEVMPAVRRNSPRVYDVKQSEIMLTAAYYGDFKGVKEAIEKGADINAQKLDDGKTALMMLLPKISDADMYKQVINGRREFPGQEKLEVINYLIDNPCIDLTIADKAGRTALEYAEASSVRATNWKGTERRYGDTVSIAILKHIQRVLEKKNLEQKNSNDDTSYLLYEMALEKGYLDW